MKIEDAIERLEAVVSEDGGRSERRVCGSLIGVLKGLRERELEGGDLDFVEDAIDRLLLDQAGRLKRAADLVKGSREFSKEVRQHLSLIPEYYYAGLGLCFGVAFGGILASLLRGFSAMPDGQSATGFGIALGLALGLAIGHLFDREAMKRNRVLRGNLS